MTVTSTSEYAFVSKIWGKSIVEFVFGVPPDIEPDIFQFKDLPPIAISELPVNQK